MTASLERSKLHVEGNDDFHSICHLLIRHGLDYDSKPWPPEFPEIVPIGSIETLLEGMETAVKTSIDRVIGFVFDANSPLLDRWRAVRDRLLKTDVNAPEQPEPNGFIGQSPKYRSRVGVWLMPDNKHDGSLEDFLQTLVDENDQLIDHAVNATNTAKDRYSAEFKEADRLKAVLHAWLAWQKEPGCPYGTAIRARYFRDDSAAALAFVSWFKHLYQIVG